MKKTSKSFFTLGLDIGNASIKCVELEWEGDQFKLSQIAKAAIENSSKEALSAALQRLFSQKSFTAKKIRIAVSGPSLIIRRVQLPRLTYSELKGAIRFEAESHIPFPIDDCVLDFQILSEAPDKKTMNVLLVAAKRELVQERLQMVAPLGLEVEVVDVAAASMINAFEKLNEDSHERAQGLLNIGSQSSLLAILHEKQLFYVREMAVGSHGITQALSEMKGIAEAEAEKLKIDSPAELAQDISSAARKGLEPLVEELRTAIDYFENESGESLREIALSGAGSASPLISQILSEDLGRHVSLWEASKKLTVLPAADQELLTKRYMEFDIALGLALRGAKQGK